MQNFLLLLQDYSALLVALGTLALAIVTAVVLIVTICWNKRNEEMRLLPVLIVQLDFSYPDSWEGASPGWVKGMRFSIENRGFGPALRYEMSVKQGNLHLLGRLTGHSGDPLVCPSLPVGQYHYPSFGPKSLSNPPQVKYQPFTIYVKCFSITGKAIEYWYEMQYSGEPKVNVSVPLGKPRVIKVKGLTAKQQNLQSTLLDNDIE